MRKGFMAAGMLMAATAACRPADVLTVPPPAGVIASGALDSQAGAESVFQAAKAQLFDAADGGGTFYVGVLAWSELLTDEFTFSGFASFPANANTDARMTAGGRGFGEPADRPWQNLLAARSSLLLALPGLVAHEPASGRSLVGEAYALIGYVELITAEDYCAGTPLSQVVPGGGIQYGTPLTTDSLLEVAEMHFDSAVAESNNDADVSGLASVGLARTLLDRGEFTQAAAAAQGIPVSFVYNVELEPTTTSGAEESSPNVYAYGKSRATYRFLNVADHEGGNGLDFVSAHDPRLTLDSSLKTADGTYGGVVPGHWYLPTKFEVNPTLIPLATGVDAALIVAEAALHSGDTTTWLADLNALRSSASGTYLNLTSGLPPLADPGTDTGRVSLMFRERAFWLFGTGTRLGDLRRLIRQYGRDQSTVFPTGTYANGQNVRLPAPIPAYGADVSLTLPTAAGFGSVSNPNYKGCLVGTTTA